MRKIITFGDRIKENYASLLGEKGLDYLNRLQKSTLQVQAFISDLQEFSMATIRAKPVKQVKLNDTISVLLSLMQKQIQEANGSVEVGDLPTIVAEASQISQVF